MMKMESYDDYVRLMLLTAWETRSLCSVQKYVTACQMLLVLITLQKIRCGN